LFPGVPQAKQNSGPATAPQAHPGSAMSAMVKIKNAATLINEALPAVPMGSEIHGEILKIATMLNKIMQKIPDQPGAQATGLVQQARQVAQQAPAQAALAQMFPQQGGAPGGAPGGPPPPPPGAAGPSM